MPDEIIIADDGSLPETTEFIENIKPGFPIPLVHIWQQDEGYQLAKIRNKAFAVARFPYIIQIDGDLILHPYFIEDHLEFSRKESFVSGTRSLLSPELSLHLLSERDYKLPFPFGQLSKPYNSFRFPVLSQVMEKLSSGPDKVQFVLGCNMAFWKEDLLIVNGYNEDFFGWGKEDNDISARLLNAGIKLRLLKFRGIVFHLYHKEAPRSNLKENADLYKLSTERKLIKAGKGLDQYSRNN